jgi:hypothetical protein
MLAVTAGLARPLQENEVPQPSADASGFPLEGAITTILNVLMWAGFAAAVGGLILGGTILAVSHATSNPLWGSRGRSMALAALIGGLIVGSAGQLVQWAANLG